MDIQTINVKKLTNVMKQYYDIKIKHLDKVVLFQLGDFYEMFFEDALKIAYSLELTLTSKSAGLEEKIPMCGIPVSAKNDYIKKMINLKYNIVIVDQVESNQLGKKLVERKVVKIISPGTYQEENINDNNFVGSISHEDKYCLAYGDVATGEMFYILMNKFNNIVNEMINLNINEVIVDDTLTSDNLKLLQQEELVVRPVISFVNENEEIKSQINKKYQYEAQRNLVKFLEYTQVGLVGHLKQFDEINQQQTMNISTNTQQQLELITSITKGNMTLYDYLNYTSTPMGKRLLKKMILHPLVDAKQIMKRQEMVELFITNPIECDELKQKLKSIYDFERLVGKIISRSITPKELEKLKISLIALPQIHFILEQLNNDYEELNLSQYDNLIDLANLIDQTIVEDAPNTTKHGNYIKDKFNEEIDELRKLKNNSNEWLMNFEMQEINKTKIKNLRIKYNKIFGYFIEVTNSNLNLVPDNYIRKQTMTNCERYITIELKEEERKILNAHQMLDELELKIYETLKDKLNEYIPRLQIMAQIIAKLDVYISFSVLAHEQNLVKPIFSEDNQLEIVQGRHPIVEQKVNNYIDNTISLLEDKDVQIITGPNMAGKSTYMRMVGLIVIMAQIGSYVSAQKAKLKIFDSIYTRIGASDDISKGLSTFMVEMLETKTALENATNNSLLIFDELGRGTSTYDGIALARSIIVEIAQNLQAKTLFSTHYHELIDLPEQKKLTNLEVVHVKAKEENNELTFYHKVMPGGSPKSYGIDVASLAGLDKKIIERARAEFMTLEQESLSKGIKQNLGGNSNSVGLEQKQSLSYEKLIAEIDLNNLTPIQALTLLSKIKEEYDKNQ